VLADCDIAGADIAGADIAGADIDCDIAGADVDCDIAGPAVGAFELLQAVRATAIVSRAAPLIAVDRMWFTFRFAESRILVGNPTV